MKRFATLRLAALALLVAAASLTACAVSLPNETLHYKVLYKWGMVHKTAGRATLSLHSAGSSAYKATLTARSEPWADKVYRLRDTLTSTMSRDKLLPSRYEKVAHEDGKYSRDVVKFSYSGGKVTGSCTRQRRKKAGDPMTTSTSTLSATGQAVDMLSAFYYLRTLDFPRMSKGQTRSINIFSGKKKETLTITYQGATTVDLNKKKHDAWLVTFTFTSDGKKSSDPIKAWISADSRRIPLKLEGSIKVGKVICEYTGS